MKKLALLFILLAASAFGQSPATGNITTSGSTCATTNACVIMLLSNSPTVSTSAASVVITGTFSGTLQFEASVDGVTFSAIPGTPVTGGSTVTSVTSTGSWTFSVGALSILRVRASAFASGTAVVTLVSSTARSASAGSGSGGSFTAGGDLSGTSSSQEVTGLLSNALPALSTGYLNWTGSVWALNAVSGGVSSVTGTTNQIDVATGTTTPVISIDSNYLLAPGPIGSGTASTGAFTTLSASSTVSGTGFSTYLAAPPAIGGTTPAGGAFTTLAASSTVSGTGFSNYLAAPPAIGGTTPAAGSFTTLAASSTVSGTGFSTYLASPPAIGGSAAAAGSFTTLSASSTVSGTGFSTYLASPPAIGGTTPAAGTFTALNCGVATSTTCIITGAGGTSGTATLTWPATAGTTTNPIVSTNAFDALNFVSTGTTAGFIDFPQGSTSTAVAPCNTATSICMQAPTSVTSYLITLAGAAATGIPHYANSANVITETISAINLGNSDVTGTLPINDVSSATGAIATIADGNNPLVINCALTSGTTCLTTGETTAATTAGAVEHQITTLTTTTAIPLQITQGAAGPAAANAPAIINVSAAAAGGAAGASSAGLTGAPISLLTGAGSAGGATTGNGGAGGAFTVALGAGGAHGGNTANTGGVGGAFSLTPGAGTAGAATAAGGAAGTTTIAAAVGGAGGATSGTGGAGSDFLVTTGTGGAATAGSTTGRGGNAVFTLGSAGGTGTAGAPGQFQVAAGTVGAANVTPFFNQTGTWNTTGVVDAGIFENVTNTASGSGSSLLDLQASTVSQLNVKSQAANSFALGPNVALGGTAPTITTGGTTPFLNMNTLVKDTKNTCTFALTTSTFTLALSPVSLCTYTLPASAQTWYWSCSMTWSNPAGTTPTFAIGVTWAQAPSAASQLENIYTTNGGAVAGISTQASTATTTNSVIGATGTLTNSATLFQAYASGTFTASATSGTFSPTVSLTGTSATGTAVGGCTIQ